MLRGLRSTHGLLALCLAFLVLAVTYSFVTPPFESPDEVGHYHYIVHVLNTHSLPVQRVGKLGEAHQPPLYYVIAALFALPADLTDSTGQFTLNPEFMLSGRGGSDINAGLHGSAETFPFRGHSLALHLARFSSALMGTITVALTVLIGWKVFPNTPLVGLLAGALVAFNPQYLFISGSVNNDNLLTLISTASWWQIIRAMQKPNQWRQWAYVSILLGVAFLAKVNGGLVIGLVAGTALLICAIEQRNPKLLLNGIWTMAIVATLISGWWFLRNQILYGDIHGWNVYREVFAVNLRYAPLQWSDIKDFFSTQFRSFFGVFGWMNVSSPDWFYRFWQILCGLGLLGLITIALRHLLRRQDNTKHPTSPNGYTLLILFGIFLAQEAYMLAVITQCNASCYQGRYLFPAISPLAIILAWGLTGFLPRERKVTAVAVLAGVLILIAITIWVPVKVISPAYKIVPLPTWRLWLIPHKIDDFNFGNMFTLRGYEFHVNENDSTVTINLYWQALQRPDFDYSVFVHLIDESDSLIAQDDHAPGEVHNYPPTVWLPGDIIADEHRIQIPRLPPGYYRFRVGVYNWATGDRLPVFVDGQYVGNWIILDHSVHR